MNEVELVCNNVKVAWTYIGEGFNGDYDPSDPLDMELLRFDVYQKNTEKYTDNSDPWFAVDGSSYCTNLPTSTPPHMLCSALAFIMREVYEPLERGESIRGVCAEMSWIAPDWYGFWDAEQSWAWGEKALRR